MDRDVRREVIRLAAQGRTYDQIRDELDVTPSSTSRIVRACGGVFRAEQWTCSKVRLSLNERIEIYLGLSHGLTFTAIASSLGRSVSTVSREVNNHGGRTRYRPGIAHQDAAHAARRPKATKLASDPVLCARVVADLERLWSPRQIARRLRAEHPDRPEFHVSHETIYKSLYVQGRGELRRELARCLRTGRALRRPQGRTENRGRIPDMVMISERPAEVEDRAVPGHWEGDLILGKNGKSAIGTLVERSTRYVMLLHLPNGRPAEEVRDAMTATIQALPAAFRRTITWDQGREMAQHRQFSIDTGVDVYFCDPHSPWQRGSNENTNGLLRQYFPKGTDLSVHTATDLQAAADSLNGRPRETLNWQTPTERLTELIATTG